jgi:hypothetical protein
MVSHGKYHCLNDQDSQVKSCICKMGRSYTGLIDNKDSLFNLHAMPITFL